MADTPDLFHLTEAAANPWAALAGLLAADAAVMTDLPRGLFFTFDPRWLRDPETGALHSTDPSPTQIDLGGPVRLCPEHLQEMLRRRDAVLVDAVIAPWGELVHIVRGGPLLVTLGRLRGRGEDLKPLKLRKPSTPSSQRDDERLSQGRDAMLTLRRAAELLPGNDADNRRALLAAEIVRDGDGRKMVRWGDLAALFPSAAEEAEAAQLGLEREARRAVETEPRRRKSKPRKGSIHLADLD